MRRVFFNFLEVVSPVRQKLKCSHHSNSLNSYIISAGIGGFMVRQRNRTGQSKTKPTLSRKDSSGSVSETQQGKDDGQTVTLIFSVHFSL